MTSFKILTTTIVLFLALVTPIYGCHRGEKRKDEHFTLRSRRVLAFAPDIEDNTQFKPIISFFTSCLSRIANISTNETRSIVKFAVSDTRWFMEGDLLFCSGEKDTEECWSNLMQFLIDKKSIFYKPAVECVKEFAKNGMESGPVNEIRGSFLSAVVEGTDALERRSFIVRIFDENRCTAFSGFSKCIKDVYEEQNDLTRVVEFVWKHFARCSKAFDLPSDLEENRYCIVDHYKENMMDDECIYEVLVDKIVLPSSYLVPLFEECKPTLRTISIGRSNRLYTNGETISKVRPCNGTWTAWFNTFNPMGSTGDFETLWRVRLKHFDTVCATPTSVDVQLANIKPEDQEIYENIDITLKGVTCKNSQQKSGKKCRDFCVRFCC